MVHQRAATEARQHRDWARDEARGRLGCDVPNAHGVVGGDAPGSLVHAADEGLHARDEGHTHPTDAPEPNAELDLIR